MGSEHSPPFCIARLLRTPSVACNARPHPTCLIPTCVHTCHTLRSPPPLQHHRLATARITLPLRITAWFTPAHTYHTAWFYHRRSFTLPTTYRFAHTPALDVGASLRTPPSLTCGVDLSRSLPRYRFVHRLRMRGSIKPRCGRLSFNTQRYTRARFARALTHHRALQHTTYTHARTRAHYLPPTPATTRVLYIAALDARLLCVPQLRRHPTKNTLHTPQRTPAALFHAFFGSWYGLGCDLPLAAPPHLPLPHSSAPSLYLRPHSSPHFGGTGAGGLPGQATLIYLTGWALDVKRQNSISGSISRARIATRAATCLPWPPTYC